MHKIKGLATALQANVQPEWFIQDCSFYDLWHLGRGLPETRLIEIGENAKLAKFPKTISLPSGRILKACMDFSANILIYIRKYLEKSVFAQIIFI